MSTAIVTRLAVSRIEDILECRKDDDLALHLETQCRAAAETTRCRTLTASETLDLIRTTLSTTRVRRIELGDLHQARASVLLATRRR